MENTTQTPSTPAAVSYAPEVIADSSGIFVGNGLRFASEVEAKNYAADLSVRWTAVRQTRVSATQDEVNYSFAAGFLAEVKQLATN